MNTLDWIVILAYFETLFIIEVSILAIIDSRSRKDPRWLNRVHRK